MFRAAITVMLLTTCIDLTGQLNDDAHAVQWASGGRIGTVFSRYNLEPAPTGSRRESNYFFELDLEARFHPRWSVLLLFGRDFLHTWRDPEARAPGHLTDDPEFITHPYTSLLRTTFLQLGGQYNYRLGASDLSLVLSGGPTLTDYRRNYDLLITDNNASTPGFAVDETRSTFGVVGTLRLNYTRWFTRRFAVGLNLQLRGWQYLSGGVDTPRGVRFELNYQESDRMATYYNVNYDITSQTPDPSTRPADFSWSINLTQRL